MKMKIIPICALFMTLLCVSCKKERTCQCTNSVATYDAGTTDGTKIQARKYCKTLSAGETECKLKE
ncbi:MAG: hypothetical protein HY062_03930 [Bacteroidetes bacterium]|nr:hypothetical protein [Bacteroidota bacterium]